MNELLKRLNNYSGAHANEKWKQISTNVQTVRRKK